MIILGIETSCDDTAAAIVKNGTDVLSDIVSSQVRIHKKYSGIVPELAARHHLENINFVIDKTMQDARCKMQDIDAIAVTVGPGLIGSLLIGTTTAQAIAQILKIPVVAVNHIEGHVFANYIRTQEHKNTRTVVKPPFIALVVSGGHTDLILVKQLGIYKVLGRTRDDAVGEAFDKIAKFLELGYPGGPVIDKLAKKGNPNKINFPRPYLWDSWDFSFSGLKTAVINYTREHMNIRTRERLSDLCASFQQACIDVLVSKTVSACKKYNIKRIALGGGVAANSKLRADFIKRCKQEELKLFIPESISCTDNAAMIASAGYFKLKKVGRQQTINPSANVELKSWNYR
ncbi:MAG: tRNA (adenosine(37)-N6)-threonylcarbamoyltransferase complex transferase subunit TsaD [Elusimicrobiota bacterium]